MVSTFLEDKIKTLIPIITTSMDQGRPTQTIKWEILTARTNLNRRLRPMMIPNIPILKLVLRLVLQAGSGEKEVVIRKHTQNMKKNPQMNELFCCLDDSFEGQPLAPRDRPGREEPEEDFFDHDFRPLRKPHGPDMAKPRTFFEDFRGAFLNF